MAETLVPEESHDRYLRCQRYIGWTEADAKRVRKAADLIEPHFGVLIDDFYEMMQREPQTARFLNGGPEQLAELKQTLRSWLSELIGGNYDRAYFERHWRVARIHVELCLNQVLINAALSRLRAKLTEQLSSDWTGDDDELSLAISSLHRLLDLEQGIVQDAYESELGHRGEQAAFRSLVESAGCMVVILREDHTIAYFNAFAERLTGDRAADVLNKDYFSIFLPEAHREGVATEISRILANGTASDGYENPIICRDGSQRWMAWNARRLEGFEPEPLVLAVGHEITSRRDAELRLRAILETAVDSIITIDRHGVIQSVNSAVERMFGYRPDELVGENVRILMPSPYRDEHDTYVANYLETGIAKIIGIGREVVGKRKDGETFPINLAVSEVRLGDQLLFTGVIRDVSEQKRAEERARQSERLAAIGQTVAGLAHESRNAFQRSQACLEMLTLELEGQTEPLELVDRTQRALDHLHHLYEEVRDYAAPINLDRQPCNLAHIWRDAWSHTETLRNTKPVTLDEDTGDVELMCKVDWFALGQVFRNILENAIAASPDDGRITIRCSETRREGRDAMRVSIRDHGPGLEPGTQAKIFDAFFTTKSKGTGLGMAIARRIVEAHEGEISIGDADSGAEFIVVLPRS